MSRATRGGGRTGLRSRAAVLAVALTALGAPAVGCVDVDGGALEVDWLVVSQGDGRLLPGCACPVPAARTISGVALQLTPRAAEGAAPLRFDFVCGRGRGTTSFSIPPGDYDIALRPRDGAGIDLASLSPPQAYAVPAVLVRRIVDGQVASLDVWTLRLDCGS